MKAELSTLPLSMRAFVRRTGDLSKDFLVDLNLVVQLSDWNIHVDNSIFNFYTTPCVDTSYNFEGGIPYFFLKTNEK